MLVCAERLQQANAADVQTPLLTLVGTPLDGPHCGHAGAVTSVVVTDRGAVMSGGLDRALCVVQLSKPKDSFRKVERAHAHGAIAVAHDVANNWFISGGFDGAVKVRRVCTPAKVLLASSEGTRTLHIVHRTALQSP
jgi:hypothetical protein